MTPVWTVIVLLGLGTYALKAAGPLLVGGRRLPPLIERLADQAPAALLAALVAASVATDGTALVIDARIIGLGAAALALWKDMPFILVVLIAAIFTAAARVIV